MVIHYKRSKNKSSIKYCWDPLEVQYNDPESVSFKGSFQPDSVADKNSKQECSSNLVSTAKLASVIGNLWTFVGQTDNFQIKKKPYYQKEIIAVAEKQRRQIASHKCYSIYYDHTSHIFSSTSTRSDFLYLKKMKNNLLFASCSTSISLFRTHGNIHDALLQRLPPAIYKRGNSCIQNISKKADGTIEIRTEENPKLIFSQIPGDKSNAIELSNIHSGQTTYSLENIPPTPSCVGSGSSSAMVYPEEELAGRSCPISDSHSGNEVEACHADSTRFQCQEVPSFLLRECPHRSDDVSTPMSETTDETSKNFIHGNEAVNGYLLNHSFSMPYKLQYGLMKHKHAIAGALAGTSVSLCLHPVDTVKTIIQSNKTSEKSFFRVVKIVILEKGVVGLYRGISSNIATSAPISAIYTFTYESVKGALLPLLPKEYYSFGHCVAGGCSSIATSFVFTPSERIKQQMQVGLHRNCWFSNSSFCYVISC